MTVTFAAGDVRADRPQRRRQDDVLQRAQRLRPRGRAAPSRRSRRRPPGDGPTSSGRAGACGRTFQTEQSIARPDGADNVLLVHEHSGWRPRPVRRPASTADGGRLRRPRGVRPSPGRRRSAPPSGGSSGSPAPSSARRGSCSSTSRRPASPRTRRDLAGLIRRIPDETGALVILVDHDMSLVSACCCDRPPCSTSAADRRRADGVGAPGPGRSSRPTSVPRRWREQRASTAVSAAGRRARRAAGLRAAGPAATSRSRCPRARSPRCSDRTAPASRRSCSPSVACSEPPPARSTSATRTSPAAGRSGSARPVSPSFPRAGVLPGPHRRRQPARGDIRARPRAGRAGHGLRPRAVPRCAALGHDRPIALGRRAADGRAGAGLGLAPCGDPRRRALPRARPARRQAPRAGARSVAASGVGVLLIEQFAHVALGLANRASLLQGGRIRYEGTARELQDNPDLLHSAYLLRA